MRTITIKIHLLNKDKMTYNVLAIAEKGDEHRYVVTTTKYDYMSSTKAGHAAKTLDSIHDEIKDMVPNSDQVHISEKEPVYHTHHAFLEHLNTGVDYRWLKQSGWLLSPLFEDDIQEITEMVNKALGGL